MWCRQTEQNIRRVISSKFVREAEHFELSLVDAVRHPRKTRVTGADRVTGDQSARLSRR